MIKKLFTVKLIFFYTLGFSQAILTYVGNSALVTIQSNTLVYNGGGLQTAGSAVVNNSGNIMINATSADGLNIANTSSFNLKYNPATTTDYGQLYIAGIPQTAILGKVNKEYRSDYQNGTTGRQQTGLPFVNFTIQDLINTFGAGQINFTNAALNSAGRFSFNSMFRWNNVNSKFDQIYINPDNATVIGNPMTYFILPRRNAAGTYFWNPTSTSAADLKVFSGNPVSDNALTSSNYIFNLSGQQVVNFGYNGSARNTYGEAYRTYLDDPFSSKTPSWSADYGRNLYQLANPFLTNIDLKFIATNETGTTSDDNYLPNLVGVAYYGTNHVNWQIGQGTTYGTAIIAAISGGAFQAGDISANRLVIKPMGEFMVKLSSNAAQTLNLSKTRRFKFTSRANNIDYTVAAARTNEGSEEGDNTIPADKVVKQVAVIMYDMDGIEIDRTYYAVSPSAISGYDPLNTMLQAYSTANSLDTALETNAVAERKIYTKEEALIGGEDINYTDKLYINEANEIAFKSKEIPLFINYSDPFQLKFEVYEKGERVTDGLSNGNSFYLKNAQGQFVKIVDGESLTLNGTQNLGLYYEMPEGGTLGSNDLITSQTIIAKKDSQWVVRFAKNWNKATVEVYSATGQLLNTKSQISTASDYSIPLNYQAKSMFIVKATSEKGEVVIKKIVN
ncbi:T9SS type A sorting domain-containing protein [Chryseobacterium sp. KACC 21268]|nr:T9SS type A sorting domain-containing protein [Chryseobacterium sp. KACC 21268]